jgi:hypothetical protein
VWKLLKKLRIELPCDPAILLLGIYPKECKPGYNRANYTSMFIAELFTIVKLWKQPNALQLMNELRKYVFIYNEYSATKNEVLSFAGKWIELKNIILSEVS